MEKKEEKIKLYLGIFVSVCILTMVFLITNTNPEELLTNLDKLEKNVHVEFINEKDNAQVKPYNVLFFENIELNNTTVEDYEVIFDNKSGAVYYTFNIKNKSSNDAVLEEYKLPNPICKGFQEDCEKVLLNLNYLIKYESGNELKANDILKAGETKKVILQIEYKAKELPSASTKISNLGFSLNFKAK